MTDIRADDATSLEDEDRLPWLEAVDEDDEQDGPSPLKLIVAVLIGLAAIGLIVGGLFWMGNRNPETGEPEMIAAQQGDYKVRPDNPGGMRVDGQGDTSFAASAGSEPQGTINVDAVPEAPISKPPVVAAPAAVRAPAPVAARPKPAPAAPAAAAAQASIQLGAFSSQASAERAWKALSGRFKYLAPLSHTVIPVSVGGKTLYRLRAGGPNASGVCGRLRVAGETCVSIA
ncbi:MAG: hypothetical protein JWN69_26 [Alphaproteobacteria bacterium]|nr:hypothetical protein [Alphaproteobacteria bacterium]